ncbi:hypothetical protein D9613_011204 [Agrocybe pediades]|uniref:Beta-lactamase-related domain-containing protein n=1 Tax=Agrocybe pediades TaxID=84607 RepID=A0A8H4VMI1_9AGAR|nr:hypothetical protein D9613_011204 [Agrocybe pediades]KAF9559764.1 beta-lactamase/transpeptidase-like protein [Agrocybe pediades]
MAQLSPDGIKALDQVVARATRERKIPGFVFCASNVDEEIYLSSNGYKVVSDPSSGPVTPDTPFWICSQTKLIVHIAALQLIEQGRLSQETAVADFFPEFSNAVVIDDITSPASSYKPARTIMRVEHLLNFTSGLYYPVQAVKNVSLPPAYLTPHSKSDPHAEFFRVMKGNLPGIPLKFEPGTNFAYGFSSDILGFIVENVTGMSLEEYCQTNIFSPLKIKASFYLTPGIAKDSITISYRNSDGTLEPMTDQVKLIERNPNEVSVFIGGIGIYTSLRDYLSLLRHLLQIHSGRLTIQGILSPQTVHELFVPALPPEGLGSLQQFTDGYKDHPGNNQWSTALAVTTSDWPGRRKKGSAFWSGWAGTFYFMDPTTGIAFVFGTQILPSRDPEVTKLYTELEETLYAGLKHE